MFFFSGTILSFWAGLKLFSLAVSDLHAHQIENLSGVFFFFPLDINNSDRKYPRGLNIHVRYLLHKYPGVNIQPGKSWAFTFTREIT